MELNHLKRFYEVAQAGGFSRAARVVRAQQPALSRAVAQLEHDLGVTLLDRGKRSVTLTEVGREVFRICEDVFLGVSNVERLAERERRGPSGVLRYGITSELASNAGARAMRRLMALHPDVWPMGFVGPASDAVASVARGEMELALFFHVPTMPADVEVRPLRPVAFRVVVAATHQKDASTLSSFIGSREMDDASTRRYPTLERIRRDRPDARIRASSNDALLRRALVEAGAGVAILPADMLTRELAVLYPSETFRFELLLVTRRKRTLSRSAERFLELLTEELESAAPPGDGRRVKRPRRTAPRR